MCHATVVTCYAWVCWCVCARPPTRWARDLTRAHTHTHTHTALCLLLIDSRVMSYMSYRARSTPPVRTITRLTASPRYRWVKAPNAAACLVFSLPCSVRARHGLCFHMQGGCAVDGRGIGSRYCCSVLTRTNPFTAGCGDLRPLRRHPRGMWILADGRIETNATIRPCGLSL